MEHRHTGCGFSLLVAADAPTAANEAARLVLESLQEQFRPLGLASGRTMEPLYAALVKRIGGLPLAERRRLLERWQSFNLDEYVGLGGADSGSFAAYMGTHLARPLGLEMASLHLPDGLASDPVEEARRYASALAAAGGLGLQVLGLGLNGHVGFNEPPCSASAPTRVVRLCPATRRQNAAAFGGDPAAVPAKAITLGLAEILGAQRVLLVVTGAAKAPVLARLLLEPPSPDLPASWLQRHPAVTLVVDSDALEAWAPAG